MSKSINNFLHTWIIPKPTVQPDDEPVSSQDVQNAIDGLFQKTPAYDITNSGYTIPHLMLNMAIPSSHNTFADRVRRTYREPLYVIYSDFFDKLSVFLGLISLVLLIIIYIYMRKLDAEKKIVFNNPNDAQDPQKQKMLDLLNNTIGPITQILSIIPLTISTWNWFKRTTKPKQYTLRRDQTATNIKPIRKSFIQKFRY